MGVAIFGGLQSYAAARGVRAECTTLGGEAAQMANGQAGTSGGGVRAAGSALPLVDLLQVWSMNRFSGLVTMSLGGETGHVYFVDGEVVHAEAGGLTGEPAFQAIIGWRECTFEPVPNTTTLKRTIDKRLSHLLLDAHRVLDEQRRSAPPPAARPPPPAPSSGRGALDQLAAIEGVTHLVRFGGDGRPVGEQGHDAEALAAKGLYLVMTHAGAVAEAFGLRDLAIVTLQGEKESRVLVHSRGSYLCLVVAGGVSVDAVASQVRAVLTRPAGR